MRERKEQAPSIDFEAFSPTSSSSEVSYTGRYLSRIEVRKFWSCSMCQLIRKKCGQEDALAVKHCRFPCTGAFEEATSQAGLGPGHRERTCPELKTLEASITVFSKAAITLRKRLFCGLNFWIADGSERMPDAEVSNLIHPLIGTCVTPSNGLAAMQRGMILPEAFSLHRQPSSPLK